MTKGFVKIYRKMKDSFLYTDSQAVHLWVHILLTANHKENKFLFNGQSVSVKEGQFVTGRKKLSIETGINENKIFRLLKCFENEQLIEQQKNNKFSIITVINWNEYQQSEQQSEQQTNNKRTTSEQQVNTNKNDKNEKNDNNEKKEDVFFEQLWKRYGKIGNKQKAATQWSKLTSVDKEAVNNSIDVYFMYLEATGISKQHLSTYLNAKNKQWENDFIAMKDDYLNRKNNKQKKQEISQRHSIF